MRIILVLAALSGFLCGTAAQADIAPFNPNDARFRNRPHPPAPASDPKAKEDKSKDGADKSKNGDSNAKNGDKKSQGKEKSKDEKKNDK